MSVNYSEDFKRQVDCEINRLCAEQERISDAISGLQTLLKGVHIDGPVKRAYRRSSEKMAPKTDSKQDPGNGVIDPKDKKKAYMAAWRAKKAAEKGQTYKPRGPKGVKALTVKTGSGNMVNKFSLERDFDLSEKDCRLMISYLVSWKGLGRLTPEEIRAYANIEGIPVGRFGEHDKNLLRDVFYSCRGRVMNKTAAESKVSN